MGHPEEHFPTIHVGGTNGKGSVCAFLAAELEAQGFAVGLYTSPHLVSPAERISVNGVPISEDAFSSWTQELKAHVERADASFFEAMTAMAFADFAARGVDIAIVEVGLGGRLDATNVIKPLVSCGDEDRRGSRGLPGQRPAGHRQRKSGDRQARCRRSSPARPILTSALS